MFQQIFQLLIDTITSLYLLMILLRFVLQLSRADFYNPVSQFIVKVTNPPLIPLRKVIPGFAGFDVAALVLAFLFQLIMLTIKFLVLAGGLPGVGSLLAVSFVLILGALLKLYFWGLLIMIIASWIAPASDNPALKLINQICEPMMAPFRKVLPSMGGLDLSPILVFIVLQILAIVLGGVSQQLGVPFSLM
jgi:YggT family protein